VSPWLYLAAYVALEVALVLFYEALVTKTTTPPVKVKGGREVPLVYRWLVTGATYGKEDIIYLNPLLRLDFFKNQRAETIKHELKHLTNKRPVGLGFELKELRNPDRILWSFKATLLNFLVGWVSLLPIKPIRLEGQGYKLAFNRVGFAISGIIFVLFYANVV